MTPSTRPTFPTATAPPTPRSARVADAEGRVVVTKDRDFRNSHLLRGAPEKLLVVATGNTSNNELLALVEANLGQIETALRDAAFVELAGDRLIIHGRE